LGAALSDGLDQLRGVLGGRDFRVLMAARFCSQVAEGAFLAAVFNTVVFLPESQSTVTGFAVATALTLLPFSLLEPFAGVFVDRWPRRPILVALPLLRAAVALVALPGLGAAVYAGTLVVFSANRLYQATATAVIPRVVGVEAERGDGGIGRPGRRPPGGALLFTANTIASVVGTVALFGGMAAGGYLAAATGAWAVVALSGVLWMAASAIGALLSSALPPKRAAGALRGELAAVVADLADGFRRIGRTPAALAPILSVAAGQFLQVIVIAAVLVVIKETLGGGLVSFSGLVAAGGVGVFLGFLTAGLLRSRMPDRLLIGVAFVLAAVALLPSLVAGDELTLTIGAVLLGASYGWTRVPADTLAQRAVPDRYRGRVFTAVDLGFNTARVLGALAAVVVVPVLGPRAACAVVAALFLLWAPVVPLWLRGDRGR
jgi:MFS family permease